MLVKTCPICGKKIKSQGYGGHMWGVHGVKVGETAQIKERLDKLEKEVNQLYQLLNKLVDGLVEAFTGKNTLTGIRSK